MSNKKQTLKIGYKTGQDAVNEIFRLDDLFLKEFKRSPKVELFYAQQGFKNNVQHEIVAYYSPDRDAQELEYFVSNL